MDRLKWDHLENGRSDKDLARRTARYHCEHCNEVIADHHRPMMMRLGVWCPEGCTVKDAEAKEAATRQLVSHGTDAVSESNWPGWRHASWIQGIPLRDGTEAGYQLSSLYALSLTWGDVAAEFVSCKAKPQDLRNFVNQWLADTWEQVRRESTWETIGKRIVDVTSPRGVVPVWGSLLTCGIDRQSAGGDRFPWVVDAWGPEEQNATIAYGECETFDEILKSILEASWRHADGGESLRISMSLMDSGHRPNGVYEFCRDCQAMGVYVFPSKGSQNALESDYRQSVLGENTSMPGMTLVLVDTIRSQLWMESQLSESSRYSLYSASVGEHQDFLEQLLNDTAVDTVDKNNNARESWSRVDANIPNDFRDTRRYSYIARLIAARGKPILARSSAPPVKKSAVLGIGASRQRAARW